MIPYFEYHIKPKLKAGETVLIVAQGDCKYAMRMYLDKFFPEEIIDQKLNTADLFTYYWPIVAKNNI